MDLLGIGASLLGGLLGAGSSGDKEQTQTRDPWKPAQPFLLDNLQTNADMQKYYQAHPFNAQQQTSYDNIFADLNNFRSNTAPGLMGFANNAMTGGYKRQQYSMPGMAGYSPNQSSFGPNSGGPGGGMRGAFGAMGGSSYGQQDWSSNDLMAYLSSAQEARAKALADAMAMQRQPMQGLPEFNYGNGDYTSGIGSNADSDGSAGSVNPGGGGISGYGGGTY